MDAIFSHVPYDTLLTLRAVSRNLRDKLDTQLFRHVLLVNIFAPSNSATPSASGVAFAKVDSPNRLLPCVPSVPSFPIRWYIDGIGHEPGLMVAWPSAVHSASNHRMLGHVRVVDSVATGFLSLPPLPPIEVARLTTMRSNGPMAHTQVRRVHLDEGHPDLDTSEAFASDMPMTLFYTLAHQDRAHTCVLHYMYDSTTPPFPVGAIRSPGTPCLMRHLVVVLPEVADDCVWSMDLVVRALHATVHKFLHPDSRNGVRFTLVGAERFGARHFGITSSPSSDLSTLQEAVRQYLGQRYDDPFEPGLIWRPYVDRVSCVSFDEWYQSEPNPLIRDPPPRVSPPLFWRLPLPV
jgi:hypothetical protein